MRTVTEVRDVEVHGGEGGWDFFLAMGPKIMDILSGQYGKLPLAVLREYGTNMIDAYVGMDPEEIVPPELHLPTEMEPWVEFKDYGVGMDFDTVKNVFSGYGVTTKDGDDENAGGFGIGGKVCFAFMGRYDTADQWTIESRWNGERMIFAATKGSNGMPRMFHLGTVPTDERNGVTIKGPVPESTIAEFHDEARGLLAYYPMPITVTGAEITVQKPVYVEEGTGWGMREKPRFSYDRQDQVIMGGVPYPLRVGYSGFNADRLANRTLDLYLPIGAVDLTPSREGLEYSPRTKDALQAALEVVDRELAEQATGRIASAVTKWDAMVAAIEVAKDALFAPLVSKLEWRGEVLDVHAGIAISVKDLAAAGVKVTQYIGVGGRVSPDITEPELTSDLRFSPMRDTLIFLADREKQNKAAAREAFLNLHAPKGWKGRRTGKHKYSTVIMLTPVKAKEGTSAVMRRLSRILNGVPVGMLSLVEIPEVERGPKATVTVKKLTSRGLDPLDAPDSAVYVTMTGNIFDLYDSRDDVRRRYTWAKDAGLIDQDAPIICIPKAQGKLTARKEYRELMELVKEDLPAAMAEVAEDRARVEAAAKVYVGAGMLVAARNVPGTHPLASLAPMGTAHQINHSKHHAMTRLASLTGIKWPEVEVEGITNEDVKVAVKRYPLLSHLSYNPDVGAVTQYVEMIDAQNEQLANIARALAL
jgi:hypothetical protein